MGVVRLVEVDEEVDFAGACKTGDLLTSGTRGDEDGAGVRVRAEDGVVLACPDVDLVAELAPKLFLATCWRPYNSFSANKARWSNLFVVL